MRKLLHTGARKTKGLEYPLIGRDLSQNEAEVLTYMAERGEATQYDVKKVKILSFPLVHHIFKRLCEKALICKEREEKSNRNVFKIIYRPTLAGFLYACTEHPDNLHILGKAEKFFPLILGKREFFVQRGIEKAMMHTFFFMAGRRWGLWARYISKGHPERELAREFTNEYFTTIFCFGPASEDFLRRRIAGFQNEEVRKIGEAIAGDPELCGLVHPIIHDICEFYNDGLKTSEKIRKKLETSLKKPKPSDKH